MKMRGLSGGREQVNAPGLGIACMLTGSFLLTVQDASVKAVSKGMPVGQIMSIRGASVVLMLVLIILITGKYAELRVSHPQGQALRALTMVAGSFLFVAGIRAMPLADATSFLFLAPIILTALAPMVLGERVGWHRWFGVGIGFAGMIVMMRPSGEGIYWVALLPAGAALCSASRDLITRRISAGDSTLATLFYSTLAVTVAGTLTLPFAWQPPTAMDIGILVVGGVLQLGAHFLMIETFRYAQASAVAPFKYTVLLYATLIGYVGFGEVPDEWTAAGAALIIAGSAYVLHRERLRRRDAAAERASRAAAE